MAPWARAACLARRLAERYDRWRAAPRPAALVLRQLPRLVRLSAWHRHTHLRVTPRLTLAITRGPASAASAAMTPPSAAASPRADRIVERVLTRATRVHSVRDLAHPLSPAAVPGARAALPPAPASGARPVARILPRARPAHPPEPERGDRGPAVPAAPHGRRPDSPSPAWPAGPAPAAPPLDIARLTDRLARELGQRVLAYRERLGRR